MKASPTWIEYAELVAFNRLAVGATGEPFQLREPGLLASSVYRPRQLAHYDGEEDVVALGCALALSIVQNHCFAQGNKRTAHAALFRFLWINGYMFREPDDPILAELLIAVAAIDARVIER